MGKWASCTFPEGFYERLIELKDMTNAAINDLWIYYGSLSLGDFANMRWFWSQTNEWACIDNCEGKNPPGNFKVLCSYSVYKDDEKRINFEKMCICLAVEMNAPREVQVVEEKPIANPAAVFEALNTKVNTDNFYNDPKDPAFNIAYAKLHRLCRELEVSHSLNYNEGSDQWHVTISSSVPSENYVTKDRSLSIAMEEVINHFCELAISLHAPNWPDDSDLAE